MCPYEGKQNGFRVFLRPFFEVGKKDISKRQIVLNRRHQKDVAGSGFAYRLYDWQPWQAIFRLAAARQCGQKKFQIACRVQPVDLCGLN